MTFKDHGYYGYAYIASRISQAITLLPIIGLVGNFLSLIAKSHHSPPSELTATIVFSAISLLWILLSITAYDDTHIPYLATAAVDTVFMIPFLAIAIVLGQPLSLTTCSDLASNSTHVLLPISSLPGKPVSYVVLNGEGQTTCYELMAVWGLIIALCVLFAMSSISAGFLFLGKRRMGRPGGQTGVYNEGDDAWRGSDMQQGGHLGPSKRFDSPPPPGSRSGSSSIAESAQMPQPPQMAHGGGDFNPGMPSPEQHGGHDLNHGEDTDEPRFDEHRPEFDRRDTVQ